MTWILLMVLCLGWSLRKIYEKWNMVIDLVFWCTIMVYNLFSCWQTCIRSACILLTPGDISSRTETWEWAIQTHSWESSSWCSILSFNGSNVYQACPGSESRTPWIIRRDCCILCYCGTAREDWLCIFTCSFGFWTHYIHKKLEIEL